jgi:hypothetical protein
MTTRPIPPGAVPCAACGFPVARRDKTGEVRLSITVRPGASIAIGGPICGICAAKARTNPESALDVLRAASPRMLDKSGTR